MLAIIITCRGRYYLCLTNEKTGEQKDDSSWSAPRVILKQFTSKLSLTLARRIE